MSFTYRSFDLVARQTVGVVQNQVVRMYTAVAVAVVV
jgi:hypothetical protein